MTSYREWLVGLAVLGAAATATFSCQTSEPKEPKDQPPETIVPTSENDRYQVTPVRGPSWLNRLSSLDISGDEMGRRGGEERAPETARREPELSRDGIRSILRRYLSSFRSSRAEAERILDEEFVLGGGDLYRLSCQSCHGPDGEGAPPEIKSLIGPIQGTSVELTLERMKERGTPIAKDMAEELASQSRSEFRQRLSIGGEKMPPFPHLRGDEIDALLGYLQGLANVPAGERGELLVTQTASRVGEHVVKGTCHICHDATGPGGGHRAMMEGIIPSLASLPEEESLSAVLRQVQYGSSRMMGMMMQSDTMPALPFLTEEEVAAAYFYVSAYPPQP